MISKEIRSAVKELRKSGMKFNTIADKLKIPLPRVKTAYYYQNKVQKRKTGPKLKINKRLSTRITRFIDIKNKCQEKVNCNQIKKNFDIPVSRMTINNWLLKRDIKYLKIPQELCLTAKHKEKRILLASSWIQENIDWMHTAFSDEKRFSLDGPDNWYYLYIFRNI